MNDNDRYRLTPKGETELLERTEFRAGQQVRILGWNFVVILEARRVTAGARTWRARWPNGGKIIVPEICITEVVA